MPRLQLILLAAVALCACEQRQPRGAQNAAAAADQKASGQIPTAITPAPTPQTSAADFVAKAAASDAFELQAGQAAQQRAANPAVKSFAAMMLRDHGKSSAELKQAVATSGQALTPSGSPSPSQQQGLADLAKVSGPDFDRAYMRGQVQAHKDALTLLQDYAQNGDTPSLTAFAAETAPVVQQHYQLASQLSEQLK